MNKTIIIMTKVPVAGTVKTRLQPFFDSEQCAALAGCFLRDTFDKANSLKIKLIIAYSPTEQRDVLAETLPEYDNFIEQKGANLGEKMFHAFEFAFSDDADSVVLIGTDSPTFPAEFISQAFDNLSEKDSVLGATTDGGFYLIGLRSLKKEMFENVEWSSPQTFEQTVRNIKNANLTLSLLPRWYDIDTPEDLAKLRKELKEYPESAIETSEFLREMN